MASLKRSFEPTNTNSKKLKESEDDPNDDLVNFQKKAIWVQMNEYKRLHENVNSDFENLKAENQRILNTVNQFCRYWTMIETELNLPHSKLSTELLSSSKDNLKALDVSWEKVKANISAKGHDMPTNIHENQLELTGSISILQGQLEIEKSKSEELEVKLEKSKAELLYTQKKLDRVKLLKEPPPIVVKKTESEQTNKQETQQTLPTEEFKDAINLAEKRLADIEALNREKLQLNLDLQKTQTELAELKGIVNSNRELENQLKLQLSEDTAKTEIEKLLRENELLVSQRRSYVEQIRNDEEKRRKALDNDLKKCEADLNRLRSARDLLQRTVEVQNAKEISDFKQLEEIKTVSESRKERIQSLESELTRLKMLIASNTGEHALMAFFDEKSDQNPYKTIAGQFEKNKQRITDLQNIIMKLENSSQGQVMETILAEKERARIAEEKLDKYTQLFGPITSNDPESLCKEQLRKKEEELSNLKGKIEYHLKAEQRLVVELETLGKAWSKLEDQNTKKLANLAEREEQLARIGTEKVKLEQKIGLLTKQNTSYHNMGIAQKRQSEKQLEQIRKLDELERSLSQQLQTLEQSVAVNAPNLEAERRKVNQLTLQLAEVRDSLEASKLKADQLVVILAQKTEQMSDISEAYRKCQEQLVVWKKKYDNVSRADPESSEERNEYRLLLMCQSCNNNFKSHCLLKCMHTFCIECIDDIYTSRQRKCPTCAIPFGMQDVKKIFL